MKKSITLFLIILSTALFADSALTHVETIIQNSRPADLPAIAGNYSALGSTHQIKGDYAKALENYKKSLHIRKAIGLDKTQGYATVLFLESIVEHKLGDSCSAMANIKKVISIYQYLGLVDDAQVAEKEGLKEFKSACEVYLSSN
ncbi:MAG: tetratricopeptide repeat protein [Leptospiraceae bacterium]|nr:tetratricopeptide repeat protein [Leptospiraceae bacterium]